MKFFTPAIFSLAFSAILTSQSVAQFTPPKDGDKLDAVVAVVGKHPIYKSSIDAQTQLFLMQRGVANPSPDTVMQLRKQILESEIDQNILLAKADEDSITVSEAEVDEQLDNIIKGYVQRLGSEAAVEKEFGRSIPELKASPDLRERTRQNLIVEKERAKILPQKESVSRQDVERFYTLYKDSLPVVPQEVELATIVKLIKPLPNQKERSLAFAKSLVDSLHHGVDFATLARRYSQHASAADGGDLGGFFPRGTFLPEFEAAAFKLKPGEVSGVVETEQGFHIIKLIDRRGEEIHVAQILIKPTVNAIDEQAVEDSLNLIRDQANSGGDFAKLAEEYSDDPQTKSLGGALGRIRVDELAPEQKTVVDSLREGQVSDPIHIAYPNGQTGFQIVKVIHKIPEHKLSMDEDYRELEAAATQWKQSQDFTQWLANARKTVYINVHDLSTYY
ncbi:MAG TPA: peptidylprolyl isomerase [Candidatus Kapabacteria bacterium]|jgi:peptidyl-prolyl cis-trans isomerase SurA|nr:peptidylprolyl isomerase [Candidatus Kapabacteria bacterium]